MKIDINNSVCLIYMAVLNKKSGQHIVCNKTIPNEYSLLITAIDCGLWIFKGRP